MRVPKISSAVLVVAAVIALGIIAALVSHPARAMSIVNQAAGTSTPTGSMTSTPVGTGTVTATAPPLAAYPVFAPVHKPAHRTVNVIEAGRSFTLSPKTLHVSVGTKVTWKSASLRAHRIISLTHSWKFSKSISQSKAASYTFKKPGTYRYKFVAHAVMKGTVIVK